MILVNIGIFIVLLLVALVAAVGVVIGVHYLAKMKSVFWSLIPSAGVLFISLLVLLIMKLAGAKWSTALITFYLLQIPVMAGVFALAPMRLHRRINVAAENEKEMRNQMFRQEEDSYKLVPYGKSDAEVIRWEKKSSSSGLLDWIYPVLEANIKFK